MTPPTRTNREIQMRTWAPAPMTALRPWDWCLLVVVSLIRIGTTVTSRQALAHGAEQGNLVLGRHPSLAWNLAFLAGSLALLWGWALWTKGAGRYTGILLYALVAAWSIGVNVGWWPGYAPFWHRGG